MLGLCKPKQPRQRIGSEAPLTAGELVDQLGERVDYGWLWSAINFIINLILVRLWYICKTKPDQCEHEKQQ
jgi:hypothetical protein